MTRVRPPQATLHWRKEHLPSLRGYSPFWHVFAYPADDLCQASVCGRASAYKDDTVQQTRPLKDDVCRTCAQVFAQAIRSQHPNSNASAKGVGE